MKQELSLIKKQINFAIKAKQKLKIVGGDSKSFYGRKIEGDVLNLSKYKGIVSYEPSELYITVRAGTLLSEVNDVLKEQNQMLAFEPPVVDKNTTIGGVVATGISGPRRPYTGSVRDFILGVRFINGFGSIVSFGGQVMKNVAGYDVSRLLTGSLGTLGAIIEVTFKVLPCPESELTFRKAISSKGFAKQLLTLNTGSVPLSGACYDGEFLYIRLSGKRQIIDNISSRLIFDPFQDGENLWKNIRDFKLSLFNSNRALWRISVPSTAKLKLLNTEDYLIDWGGAQYWVLSDRTNEQMFEMAEQQGGSAILFIGGDNRGEIFQPLSKGVFNLHAKLKKAFDPYLIFNYGKMYPSI